MKYIFVEGFDDKNFIDEIINECDEFKIIEYASQKKEKIDRMINTFDKMGEEYIFLADLDEKSEEIRKKELKRTFKNLNTANLYFSIQEIEAWYLSGVSDKCIKKFKIKNRYLLDTENITKEKFEKIFCNSKDTMQNIKLIILSEFDLEKAKSRNNSLKLFLENAI